MLEPGSQPVDVVLEVRPRARDRLGHKAELFCTFDKVLDCLRFRQDSLARRDSAITIIRCRDSA